MVVFGQQNKERLKEDVDEEEMKQSRWEKEIKCLPQEQDPMIFQRDSLDATFFLSPSEEVTTDTWETSFPLLLIIII